MASHTLVSPYPANINFLIIIKMIIILKIFNVNLNILFFRFSFFLGEFYYYNDNASFTPGGKCFVTNVSILVLYFVSSLMA